MDQNPYESPRDPEDLYESKPRAGWLDALPGIAVIAVFLLSPFIAHALQDFGFLFLTATLISVIVAAIVAWAILRKAIGG